MRFFYSIILGLLCQIGFSQTYKFNLLTTYKKYEPFFGRFDDCKVYSNIDDQTYFLRFNENGTATIGDIKSQSWHDLEYKYVDVNGKKTLQFKHKKSRKSKRHKIMRNHTQTFETIKEDSTHKTIKVTHFSDLKRKKIVACSELIVKKASMNLFPLFRYSYLHLFEKRTEIDPGENCIVESIKPVGDEKFSAWLDSAEKIDIEINLDSKK